MLLKRIAPIVAFQVAWLATAFSVPAGHPSIGIAGCLAAFAVGLILSGDRPGLLLLAASLGLFGLVAESLLRAAGLVSFAAPGPLPVLAPLWIITLWGAFAAIVEPAFSLLRGRSWLAALIGAVFAPLSYLAAERAGALTVGEGEVRYLSLSAIAIVWAIALPGAVRLSTLFAARASRR